MHSMKLSEKPLEVAVLVFTDGTVSTGSCTCMAGKSKGCSHIAATLFAVEAGEPG